MMGVNIRLKRRNAIFGWLLAAVVTMLVGEIGTALAGADTPVDDTSESLDRQLLEDLSADLFDDDFSRLTDPEATGRNQPPTPGPRPDAAGADGSLGEDLGAPSRTSPLERVNRNMRTAESLIAARDTSGETSDVQRQIVADLDALIDQLSKKCQGACQKPGSASQSTQRSQVKASKSGMKLVQGRVAARDSTDRLSKQDAKPIELADVEALVKELWGHLPDRAREQLLQSSNIEFLPKYQREIEQYFRHLAEEEDGASADE